LGLELSDPGFHYSVLSEFRQRLLDNEKERLVFDLFLTQLREQGYLKMRGQQRTDSTHVLAKIRSLNRIEGVGETFRAALNTLAVVAPEWLQEQWQEEWIERYEHRVEAYRLPDGKQAREAYAICPAGRTSQSWTPAQDRRGNPVIKIKFAVKDRRPCASRSQCTQSQSDSPRRTLTVRPQQQYQALQAARQRQVTAGFKTTYNKRAGIEGTLSQSIRAFGLRQARYQGLVKVHLQHIFTATALNFTRIFA
jgi:hypothetical protein